MFQTIQHQKGLLCFVWYISCVLFCRHYCFQADTRYWPNVGHQRHWPNIRPTFCVSCLRHWPNVDHLRCWSNIRSTLGQVSLPPITSSVASSLHMFLFFYFFVLSLCSGSDLLYRHISVAYNPLQRNVYFTFYAANLFVDTFHSFEAGNASVIYSSKLQKKYPSVKINYLINWASIRNYFIGFRFFSDKTKVNKVPLECLLIDNLINNGFWKVSIFVNIIFFAIWSWKWRKDVLLQREKNMLQTI